MNVCTTLLSPSSADIKDPASYPHLGKNSLFERAKKHKSNTTYCKGSKLPKIKGKKRNESLIDTLNRKVNEENKKNVMMIKSLHLITEEKMINDSKYHNPIEKFDSISQRLTKIKNKIITHKQNRNNYHSVEKMVLKKENKHIDFSPNKVSLTERSNDKRVSYNQTGIINLLNLFDCSKLFKQIESTKSNKKSITLTESSKTTPGVKNRFKKMIIRKRVEVEVLKSPIKLIK